MAIKTIDKLDDKYKIVLLLKYACHLDRKAIADLCGISLENVKKRISRAKTMVCETLKKEDVLK